MHSSLKPWLLRLQQSLDTTPTATENQLTQAKETKHVFGAIEDGAAVEISRNEPKPEPEKPIAPIDLSESCSFGETNGLQLLTPCLPRRSSFLNPIVESHPDGEISELAKSNNVTEFSNDLHVEDPDKSTVKNPDLFGVQLVPGLVLIVPKDL